jgi:hypothetical protein
MMMLAAVVLPALLAPQVRTGQQLHYHTTWTTVANGPQVAGVKPAPVERTYTVRVSDASAGQLSWTQQYTPGPDQLLKFSSDASGEVVDRNSHKATGVPGFVYDAALLGQPPDILRPGATWTNAIRQPGSDAFWTSTVEEANPATGVVRLRLIFQSRGERGLRGDKSVQDEREDGEALFVRGIMTKLSLQGRQIVTLPQRRFTDAFTIETHLEDPGR